MAMRIKREKKEKTGTRDVCQEDRRQRPRGETRHKGQAQGRRQ